MKWEEEIEEQIKERAEKYAEAFEAHGVAEASFIEGAEFGCAKAVEKMKSDIRTAYIKGIRTMANALKKYDREEGAWTDYFEHTVDKVLKSLLKG